MPSLWMFADDVEDLLHQQGRQTHGGLVQHQHGGVAHQRTAHGQHLLLAAGHGAGQLLAALLQAGKQLKHLFLVGGDGGGQAGCKPPMSRFSSTVMCRKTWRPSGTCARPASTILWARHALDALRPCTGRRRVLGCEQAGNGLQGGGLTRTVGADQGDDLALVHLEGDVLYGVDVAVIDVDVIHLQHGLPSLSPPSCPGRPR